MRRFAVITGLTVVLTALAGCAGPDPGLSPEPSPPPSSPEAQSIQVDAFFAHSQPTRFTLISESHAVVAEADAVEPVLEAALSSLISGELQPRDPDYSNLWGSGSAVLGLSRSGDVLTIDVNVGTLSVGAEAESIAVAQVIATAVRIDPTIASVQFTVDGAVAETLAGHVDITGPIALDAPENVLSPLQIVSPDEGETIASPVTVTGVACVFEATFGWRLEGPDGEVVDGFGMAAESCPARADWQLELGDLEPGDYLLTVIEYSMQDGSVASTDSKAFTVVG
jgi:hypothetical protein